MHPERYLKHVKQNNQRARRNRRNLGILSALVVLGVFWNLKLTGITMAGEAFCGKDEHIHGESCPTGELVCTLVETEAHTHSESCIQRELICQEPEREGHTHTGQCESRELLCTEPTQEGHTHGDGCVIRTRTCGQEERQGHTHGDGCYEQVKSCTLEEDDTHTHGEACYESRKVCTLEEDPGHAHTDSCYTVEEGYSCGIHVHTDSCYSEEVTYICGQEEDPGHTHGESCYQLGIGFGCGQTEAEGHVHTQACITGETQIDCGIEASEGHTHGDECYRKYEQCPLEEHIHEESCYSDLTADLETEDDWEMSLAGLTRSPVTAENVVAVARSQLGQVESTRNFQVDANGIRRGITRYGQWYGNPYGDWSAMFASFCLHYAGVEDLPANAGPESMRLEWEEAGCYTPAGEYAPQAGNLLFLHLKEENQEETVGEEALPANAVAIITGFDGETVSVIQGDLDNAVKEATYAADDPQILGYGLVPEDPTYAALVEAPEGAAVIARTVAYSGSLFEEPGTFVVYTTSGSNVYAFDGNGDAVQVYIDDTGNILAEVENPNTLLWTFTGSDGTYLIQNVATKRYMHAYPNNGTGVTTSGAYSSTLIASGNGVKIRSNAEYARLDMASGTFVMTQNPDLAAVYQFGINSQHTVWLDGTGGEQQQLMGSPDSSYSVLDGGTFTLPTEWPSPEKYEMKLRGWYDVTNHTWYAPGAEVTVTGNMVFYADWVAATYDIGRYTAQTSNTVSTSSFITTHVFDYNYLFNVQSANPTVTISSADHSESWSLVQSGNVDYNGQETLNFVFVDNDGGNRLTAAGNRNNANSYLGAGRLTYGIYNADLGQVLFGTNNGFDPSTGSGIIGKTYLGTGDYLLQFEDDPDAELYGYYYYDSQLHAASYNRSAQRFYVYNYLEATTDSYNGDVKSDFLPLNSPYANTNGKSVRTYAYAGDHNEYTGVDHYRYDAKYSDYSNATDYVGTNYAFGMKMDVRFYLPIAPGTTDANGDYGNKDLYGNDMHFQFSGDDDVWVLVDGKVILDLGGIHGIEGGDINFSTGVVTVNGGVEPDMSTALKSIPAGEHTLSICYLERGSSQSNCAFYFNLAPRYGLTLQKEDVLTQELLDGAEFSVYTDHACTQAAKLYTSERAYYAGEAARNTFSLQDGKTYMWGLAAGNTYYIRETKAPDGESYGLVHGLIRLVVDKDGKHTYYVDVVPEADGTKPSNGFTVHGIQIDDENQEIYIVATNAQAWVKDVTTVQVMKKWDDSEDHSDDYVTVYLTVTDSDGTVRRIREVLLSEENDWTYTWTNLPEFAADGKTAIVYGIEEAYVPGYQGKVDKVDSFRITTETLAEAAQFQNGEVYLLKTANGYLSTSSAANNALIWVSEDIAKASPCAQWRATVSSGRVKFTNEEGQILTFNSSSISSRRYFYATTSSEGSYQNMGYTSTSGGYVINNWRNSTKYYMGSLNASTGRLSAAGNSGSALVFQPMTYRSSTTEVEVENLGFQVTNVPLEEETAFTVHKVWSNPLGDDPTQYQTEQVTIRLLANGVETGRSVTLNLQNGWQATFQGLPYKDEERNVIAYTVKESWSAEYWTPSYGEIQTGSGSIPTYSTTVTNVYRAGGPVLPSTGTAARMLCMLFGGSIMLASAVYGIVCRRKQGRRRR